MRNAKCDHNSVIVLTHSPGYSYAINILIPTQPQPPITMTIALRHDGSNGDPSPPTHPPDRMATTTTSPYHGTINDSTTIINQKVRIDINRPASDNTAYPVRALLMNLIQELRKADPASMLLPIDENSTAGALKASSDVPTGTAIEQYIAGFQDAPNGRTNRTTKTVRVFVRIGGPQSLRSLKRNTGLYTWLNKSKIYLRTHGFSTTYNVASAGFLCKMSSTLNRRDTLSNIIRSKAKDIAPEIEICLVPNQITIGTGDTKYQTDAVEVQVDRQYLQKARELMIELFETNQADLPADIYFVPSPTNGTMTYDLYYQHLRLHHDHVANLRSFAITNVSNIKHEILVYDEDGVSNPREMPLDAALLHRCKAGTTDKMFSSIETTQYSESDGRYLLVTHKDTIKEAEAFIDDVFNWMRNTPGEMEKITKVPTEPVRRANRIATSNRFQDYATKLQNLIPSSITTPAHHMHNAWKRRTPTAMNLTDADFPELDSTKKPRTDEGSTGDTATTTTNDATESITLVDLDLIEQRQLEIQTALRQEIVEMRTANDTMQRTLQEQFNTAMMALEVRMETNTQKMIDSLGASLTRAVATMNAQAESGREFLTAFKEQADRMQMQADRLVHRNHRRTHDTPPRKKPGIHRSPLYDDNDDDDDDDMNEYDDDDDDDDYNQADGSLNPTTSRAKQPKNGANATAANHK
jgi:hypothetical protein